MMSQPNGLAQVLPQSAARHPHKVALVTATRSLTYAELDAESTRLAAALEARGLEPGDRVTLLAENRWEWVVSYHAVLKAGGVVNPANVMLTEEEMAFVMNDAGTAMLIVSGERLTAIAPALKNVASLREVVCLDRPVQSSALTFTELLQERVSDWRPREINPDHLASIAYTSGTTGYPKGAMQSHRSLVLNCAMTAAMHSRTSFDVVVSPLPCPHVYGNVVINSTFMAGGTVVLMERFGAAEALTLIEQHRATMFEGVPAMYAMLLSADELSRADLSSLQRCTVGGQTIAGSVMAAWERCTDAPLIELWGMTEISGLGTTHALHAPNVHGSIGMSLPGVQVKVASLHDPAVEALPDEHGELLVRGPIVMMGYHNNPSATAEVLDSDGWLHTGDVATHDGLGHFFVVDRLKDMIVTAGHNVYPAEIERVMIEHEAVALVAVGKVDDAVKGEVAHAYVVKKPGYETLDTDLLSYCRTRLAAYKVPKAVHFVSELPTTSSGKLMRRKLSGHDRVSQPV